MTDQDLAKLVTLLQTRTDHKFSVDECFEFIKAISEYHRVRVYIRQPFKHSHDHTMSELIDGILEASDQ